METGPHISFAQAAVVSVFVSIHLFGGRLKFLDTIPRSRLLSMAGGISVAYVFLHILPELAEAETAFDPQIALLSWIEHHAYLVALFGLGLFYGLERLVKSTQRERQKKPRDLKRAATTRTGVFWLHLSTFALYNGLIAYLLVHREDQDSVGLFLFSLAMALHFLVNDFGLRQDHRKSYHQIGRWILAGTLVVGWMTGLATKIEDAATDALFALLAGSVILNVLKEELPEERQSRFLPFATGALLYSILLLIL